jgi:uncharacterized Zn finger protein (UPF0148 family)
LKVAGKIKEKALRYNVGDLKSASKSKSARCTDTSIEVLKEGQECPFCHFAKMKRDGGEVICPICGYGHRAST